MVGNVAPNSNSAEDTLNTLRYSDRVKELKDKNYTIYSIPGGEFVSVGGAVSANVIGKDSSNTLQGSLQL